jgi:S1-C subfamily serine protease
MRWLLLLLTLFWVGGWVWADSEDDRIAAVELGRKSVVSLRVYRPNVKKPGVGSGIVMRSDGFILTNSHVVEGAKVVRVGLPGGKQYNGRIWKEAPDQDLALIKIEAAGLTVARIGNSDLIKLGQTAIAIGDPLGFSGTVTVGTVGGVGRDIKVGNVKYPHMLQTDAAINPGSSGGALINLAGEVIGVNTLIYTGSSGSKPAQGLGFAIPINHALGVAKNLISQKPASTGKPWIGITGENLNPDLATAHGIPAKRGVVVTSVIAGGPADLAGMRIGDAIVSCDGKVVLSLSGFLSQLATHKVGDTVTLSCWRGGKKTSVKVTLDVSGQ